MPGPLASIRFETKPGYLRGVIEQYIRQFTKFDANERARLDGIINRGVMQNHRILMFGGAVPQAGGGLSVAWLQVRHPLTIQWRQRRHLPAIFPLLYGTGRLQQAYAQGGRLSTSYGGLRWTPASSDIHLIKRHELGGDPVGSNPRTGALGGTTDTRGVRPSDRIPARPSIFWSESMARQALDILKQKGRMAKVKQ